MNWEDFKAIVEQNGVKDKTELDFIDCSLANTELPFVMCLSGPRGMKIMTDLETAGREMGRGLDPNDEHLVDMGSLDEIEGTETERFEKEAADESSDDSESDE